jgi:hypothetical protein
MGTQWHSRHSNASAAVATAVAASSNPQKRRLYKAIAAGVSVLLLFVGFIAGFFTARQMGARDLTACYASIQRQSSNISKTSDSSALRELPPPGRRSSSPRNQAHWVRFTLHSIQMSEGCQDAERCKEYVPQARSAAAVVSILTAVMHGHWRARRPWCRRRFVLGSAITPQGSAAGNESLRQLSSQLCS